MSTNQFELYTPCICIQDLSRKYDLVETITTLSRKSSRKYKIALSSQKLSVYDSYLIISTTFKVKCRYFAHGKKLILSSKIKKAILILLHEKALRLEYNQRRLCEIKTF